MMLCSRTHYNLHQAIKGAHTQPAPRQATVQNSRPTGRTACSAAGTALALVIGFLPWKGCSQGGFYDTGVAGRHGENCQAIYQPAAAAEARLAESLSKNSSSRVTTGSDSSSSSSNSHQQQHPVAAAAAAVGQLAPALVTSEDLNISSGSSSSSFCNDLEIQCVIPDLEASVTIIGSNDASIAEQLQQVPDAAKDLVRNILRDDNQRRTKQLVDDAWQTLE